MPVGGAALEMPLSSGFIHPKAAMVTLTSTGRITHVSVIGGGVFIGTNVPVRPLTSHTCSPDVGTIFAPTAAMTVALMAFMSHVAVTTIIIMSSTVENIHMAVITAGKTCINVAPDKIARQPGLILNALIANMAAVALSRRSVTMIDIPTMSTASSTGYVIATGIAGGFLAIKEIGSSLASAQPLPRALIVATAITIVETADATSTKIATWINTVASIFPAIVMISDARTGEKYRQLILKILFV